MAAAASLWCHLPPTWATATVHTPPVVVVVVVGCAVLLILSWLCPDHCTDPVCGLCQQRSGRRRKRRPSGFMTHLSPSPSLCLSVQLLMTRKPTSRSFGRAGDCYNQSAAAQSFDRFLHIITVWSSEDCQKHTSGLEGFLCLVWFFWEVEIGIRVENGWMDGKCGECVAFVVVGSLWLR